MGKTAAKTAKRVHKSKFAFEMKRTDAFRADPDHLWLEVDEDGPLFDPRARLAPDEALVLHMMQHGTKLSVVLVDKVSEERVRVVAGRRRVVACREANRRLQAEGKKPLLLTCLVVSGDEADLLGMMIAENELRLPDTPLNRARKLQDYLDLGKTLEEAAIFFGQPVRTLKSLQALRDCSVKVKSMVEEGQVPLSKARKYAKLPVEKQEEEAVKDRRPPKGKKGKGEAAADPEPRTRGKGRKAVERMRAELDVDLNVPKGELHVARELLDYVLGRKKPDELETKLVKALAAIVE